MSGGLGSRTTAPRPKEIELWAKSVNGGHPTSRCARYALAQEARCVRAEEALRHIADSASLMEARMMAANALRS